MGLVPLNLGFVGGCLESFDAPDEAGGPGFLGVEGGAPEGENLGALVDAFETFFGFGNSFNRGDPEFFHQGRVQRDADALPAIFHAEDGAGKRAAETQVHAGRWRLEEAVWLRGSEKIDDGLNADGEGLLERLLEFQADLAGNFASMGGGAESILLDEQQFWRSGFRLAVKSERVCAEKLRFVGSGILHSEYPAGKAGVFLQLESFVVGMRARRIEKQDAESVARPAIVTEKTLEAGLLDASLFVDRSDRVGGGLSGGFAQGGVIGLRPAQDGIHHRRGSRAEIERRDGPAVSGLQERLVFGGGEKEFVGAVGVVVQLLDTRNERAGSMQIGDGFGANQVAPRIGAEMRGVDAAENAMPIGIVALGAQEQIASLQKGFGGFRAGLTRGSGGDARGNAEHFLVEQIGFGVLAKEAAPGAAAKEGEHLRTGAEFLEHGMIALPDPRGQDPLHHFRVRSGRKIGAAERRMGRKVFAGRGNFQPIGIFLERGEKLCEPSVRITVFVRAGPDAEFFHVVAHRGDATGMEICGVPQIRDDLFDFAEGDEVAQRLVARIEPHGLAAIFGDVVSEKLLRLEAGGEEVDVIHKRVGDVCGGECGWKLGFPDTFGEPSAGGKLAEMSFEIGGEARDLFSLIFRRDRNQNGFVKAAANELDLAALDQFFQAREIFGAMFFDPGEERAGVVQAEMNARMFFQFLDKGEITGIVGFFQDMLEIAAGLVGVNEQSEMETLGHGDRFFSRTMITSCTNK